jgi:hypothetical protein
MTDKADDKPCPYVTGNVTRYCTLTPFTLTDEERQAIAWVCGDVADITGPTEDTLRGLLERTKLQCTEDGEK